MADGATPISPRRASGRQLVTAIGLAEAFSNLAVPLMYCSFAYTHVCAFLVNPRASVAAQVALETLFAVFYVARRPASEASLHPWDWATAMGGTFLPMLLRPSAATTDFAAGEFLQIAAGTFTVWGIWSLSRSIGLLPANRGIRSGGPYRWVRHPLYAGYTFANVGYLLSNRSAMNAAVVGAATAFQILRTLNEERLLSRDAEYRAYSARTRWRLLPFVY